MTLSLTSPPVPLTVDADGVARVANTRVTLDTIVTAFHEGLSAEEIAQQYPSVPLADVYAVIGFYLARRQDVDSYLRERHALAAPVRQENETRFDPNGVRERLLARRNSKQTGA